MPSRWCDFIKQQFTTTTHVDVYIFASINLYRYNQLRRLIVAALQFTVEHYKESVLHRNHCGSEVKLCLPCRRPSSRPDSVNFFSNLKDDVALHSPELNVVALLS